MAELNLAPLLQRLEEFIPEGRPALLPALHAAQEIYGYLPEPVVTEISRALRIPLADVYGVIEFYALFYRVPVGKTVIHICNDPACAMAGSEGVMKQIAMEITLQETDHGIQPEITIERAACLGLCEHAPAMLIRGRPAIAGTTSWKELVAGKADHPHSVMGGTLRLLSGNCGRDFTTSLMEYRTGGGYQGLAKALTLSPQAVIAEVKASGLVGRGGAAFPTGLKWESAANAPSETRYVVCNGDEAEPGTFKDRVMMEDDPHRVLEGLIISAYAIGARKGYWYIRGEYLHPYQVVQNAVVEARQAGFLGNAILGTDFSFEVELRRGAGAYICGEETALFESIEGKRGFPRIKPPFPTTYGLFGQPTVINNVETLINIPLILKEGAQFYRQNGTEKSPGTKLFCVSGDVMRPGLYEVPFGFPLRSLLNDLCGGIRAGHTFQAALFGGAAGAFATPAHLDLRLSFEDLKSAGLPLGSGVITVFDAHRDIKDALLRISHFFAEESCGKCYPCQLGTQRQYEIIHRLVEGSPLPGDLDRLQDVGWTMASASLCGLGQTAASAVLSAIQHWPNLFKSSAGKPLEVF